MRSARRGTVPRSLRSPLAAAFHRRDIATRPILRALPAMTAASSVSSPPLLVSQLGVRLVRIVTRDLPPSRTLLCDKSR